MRAVCVWGWVGVLLLVGCGGNDNTDANDPGSSVTGATGVGGSEGSSTATGTTGVDASGGSSSVTGTSGVNTSGGGSGGQSQVVVAELPDGGSQTEFAVNLVDAEILQALVDFLSQPTDVDYEELDPSELKALDYPSRVFYQYFKDEYDFLFFISPDELDVNLNGLHSTVHSLTLPGTGVTKFSATEYHGSDGTLMSAIGFVFRGAEQRPPFAHEVLHHYAQYLDESLGFGDDFKGGEASHWGTTSVNGVLGGFDAATLRCKTPADAMPPGCTAEDSGRIHYVADAFSPLSSSAGFPPASTCSLRTRRCSKPCGKCGSRPASSCTTSSEFRTPSHSTVLLTAMYRSTAHPIRPVKAFSRLTHLMRRSIEP